MEYDCNIHYHVMFMSKKIVNVILVCRFSGGSNTNSTMKIEETTTSKKKTKQNRNEKETFGNFVYIYIYTDYIDMKCIEYTYVYCEQCEHFEREYEYVGRYVWITSFMCILRSYWQWKTTEKCEYMNCMNKIHTQSQPQSYSGSGSNRTRGHIHRQCGTSILVQNEYICDKYTLQKCKCIIIFFFFSRFSFFFQKKKIVCTHDELYDTATDISFTFFFSSLQLRFFSFSFILYM